MSLDGVGAIYGGQPSVWGQPEPRGGATPHRQRPRWRERSVAIINSYPASYDESAARQRHQRYRRIAPVINDIAITIIVVLAMRRCIGLVEEALRRDRSLAGRPGAHPCSTPYSVERATLI